MTVSRKLFLLDGPMLLSPERKADMAAEMGRKLLDGSAYLDRGDAIRLLRALDYSVLNVMLVVDDARHWAMEEILAKEMSEA